MTHTAQNIYDAFNDRGFSKFYLLTITDKAFENLQQKFFLLRFSVENQK